MVLPIKYNHQIQDENTIETNIEDFIESLAELSGFKVYKILDEHGNNVGFTMELIEWAFQ